MSGLQRKLYIGDGVYVAYDGYQVWLWTQDGLRRTNQIALEPDVLLNLESWLRQNFHGPTPDGADDHSARSNLGPIE